MAIADSWKPLTIITKSSTLDTAAALDPLLFMYLYLWFIYVIQFPISLEYYETMHYISLNSFCLSLFFGFILFCILI